MQARFLHDLADVISVFSGSGSRAPPGNPVIEVPLRPPRFDSSEVLVKRLLPAVLTTLFLCTLIATGRADDPQAGKAQATKKVKAGEITLNVPEEWKQKETAPGPRVAEFEVPPAGDDKEPGEFAVFFFGPQGAGGGEANVQRWVGQLDEDGRKVKIASGESSLGKYTLVDLTGSYNKSIGPPIAGKKKKLPGWRVINVFVETDAGPYFLKLDGPQKTIATVEDDFRTSFGGKKETEKEQKK
jgi:gluconolactonase